VANNPMAANPALISPVKHILINLKVETQNVSERKTIQLVLSFSLLKRTTRVFKKEKKGKRESFWERKCWCVAF
jgi:hypothetical protein